MKATILASDNARQGASLRYRAMRDFVQSTEDTLPGKFEVTKEGIVHGMTAPVGPHELTAVHLRKRLERLMPDEIVAHTGEPDVEDEPEGIMRRPDVVVITLTDIHRTPDGPRYATRKDFVYGEDVTIADWTISTDGLPRYAS
ncbi:MULTISPECIES: hypothetical protein [Streptomyces]|uniref:SnoaL-like domain-containing protein n=2 Tax=Streptomyces TaxID=1883 RepID=A0ABV9IXU1_9ACTN